MNALQAAGVDAKAIDVSTVKDRFPIYHKSVSGPDATVRPVFGAKGALVDDFGTNVPALLVFEGDRYPTQAFPRTDAKRGTIRVEQALEDLVAERKGAAVGGALTRRKECRITSTCLLASSGRRVSTRCRSLRRTPTG